MPIQHNQEQEEHHTLQAVNHQQEGTAQEQQAERKPNKTGIPDRLKAVVEHFSGFSLDEVRVHYNSEKPAEIDAYAYTEGFDIYVAPGQEKHLAHELWHVVQQMKGKLKATKEVNGKEINEDKALEKEADTLPTEAAMQPNSLSEDPVLQKGNMADNQPVQRKLYVHKEQEDASSAKELQYDELKGKIEGGLSSLFINALELMAEDESINTFALKEDGSLITVEEASKVILDWLEEQDEEQLEKLRSEESLEEQRKGILEAIREGNIIIPEGFEDIPDEEIAAIRAYSMQGYSLNYYLRKIEKSNQDKGTLTVNGKLIEDTKKGLERIEPYEGWVYRGQDIPSSMEDEYVEGESIVFKGFTSTTKSASESNNFKPSQRDNQVPQMLTIYSTTGRDISTIAHDPTEQEVLFAPDTEFKIQKITKQENMPDEVILIQTKDAPNINESDIPNRVQKAQEERETLEDSKEQSGPSETAMLMALLGKAVDIPQDINSEMLVELYKTHFSS